MAVAFNSIAAQLERLRAKQKVWRDRCHSLRVWSWWVLAALCIAAIVNGGEKMHRCGGAKMHQVA